MKKWYFLVLSLCVSFLASAQPYDNEWINYSQKYYKIKVIKDGIYRIDSLTLARAGINLDTINPQRFQVFYHGLEQYIYVRGESKGVFSEKDSDYIEFYGQHNTGRYQSNDGASDSLLYSDPSMQSLPNPYYSLFCDTSTYYLTWNINKVAKNKRMTLYNNTSFTISPSSYFIAQTDTAPNTPGNTEYYSGFRVSLGSAESATDPRYTAAKGWMFPELDYGYGPQPYTLAVSNVYGSGPNAIINTLVAGESTEGPGDHQITITPSWPSTPTNLSFTGFQVIPETYNVPANQILSGASLNFICSTSLYATSVNAVCYVSIQYPHTPNLGNASSFMMYVPDNKSNPNSYFRFTNFNTSPTDSIRIYDLTTGKRIVVTDSSGVFKVIIPNSVSPNVKQCYIVADAQVNKVTRLIPVGNIVSSSYSPGTFTNIPAMGVDSAYIIITHPSLWGAATNYQAYRSLTGYKTVLISAEELYDQFCYGIEKDPLAIRNFCNSTLKDKKNWHSTPSNIFLIGKGLHESIYRQDPVSFAKTLIPSAGNPSCDILLTAGLNGTYLQPAIPTGRIAAVSPAEVGYYLNKVDIYEHTTPAQWQKRVIHFCGGSTTWDQTTFRGYLNAYQQIVTNPFFGANVYTFSKLTSDPIQITLADSITSLINNGVSIMTFFGHASGNNFDENLDAPGDYNNVNKYPMIIADACFSGDIFSLPGSGQTGISEQFVLDQKGSIGFLATDDLGEESSLFTYTDTLYKNFTYENCRKPFGYCIQNTIKKVQVIATSNAILQYACLEMTLHGDPAVALLPLDSLPDYAVSDSSIYFTPANVTTQIDSFKLNLIIANNAEAVNKPVIVQLERIFSNGSDTNYQFTLNHIYYQDTITIKLPVDKVRGPGLNHFYVNVNPGELIKETTMSNNTIGSPGITLWITSGDIVPVWPYQFAIIPYDTITLKASTGDPFAANHKYIFEIDTTANFNSPFLKTQIVSAKGGVVNAISKDWVSYIHGIGGSGFGANGGSGSAKLRPVMNRGMSAGTPLFLKDSTVYYWQVRRDTNDIKDFGWEQSSFQYIPGKNGWAQAHYFQFLDNAYTYMQTDIKHRGWVFDKTGKTLQCNTYGMTYNAAASGNQNTQLYGTGYKLDYTEIAYAGCQLTQGIYVAVINPVTLQPWHVLDHPGFGNSNAPGNSNGCNADDHKFMYWYNDPNQMAGLTKLLDSVPNGYYILAYTWVEGMFKQWADKSSKPLFVSLGASSSIYTRPDTLPWIFFVQKGNRASAIEKVGRNNFDSLQMSVKLTNNEPSGSMLSAVIGPATKWDSISWRQHSASKLARDSVRMTVIGVDNYGNSKTLINGVPPAVANMYIKSINTKQYPYLQLSLYTKDTLTRTPSQMNKWQVFYTPVPEVAINPSIYYSFYKDTLEAGDTVRFKTVVQNIGTYPMDSMIYNTWIADANNALHYLPVKRIKKLNPGDTAMVWAKSTSLGYNGTNSIWIEANPQFLPQTRPEQYHFNNQAKKTFIVQGQNTNPLLDVTFDGIHILNNDIVSSHPNILITLSDESKYLALNYSDTSKIALYIRNVNSNNSVPQRVYISNNPQIVFTPGTVTNNKCKVLYTPTLADGTYELTVQGANIAGILSGSNVYKIDFVVINKSMISNVLNYPNPFSTSTRFVFTLTGEEVPTYFKIQIMTVTGKIVKEITEAEIGPLHIGTNITQYAWDGTDQFGDKLGNGIYLYHLTATINGQSIDHYDTGTDQYFTKGWGKMYLMR